MGSGSTNRLNLLSRPLKRCHEKWTAPGASLRREMIETTEWTAGANSLTWADPDLFLSNKAVYYLAEMAE